MVITLAPVRQMTSPAGAALVRSFVTAQAEQQSKVTASKWLARGNRLDLSNSTS
jgi:hypothetical protein